MLNKRIYESIIKKEPLSKGWSEDKKYCVSTADGIKYLLRLSPISQYETKKLLFDMTKQITELDVPMCVPIEFGVCGNEVYTIQSWINGIDLETVLPSLPEKDQYSLGLQAGEILKKIHSIQIPEPQEDWAVKFNRDVDAKIQEYRELGVKFDGDEHVFSYIENNRHLLETRPQSFLVWDYNILNMMFENNSLQIIDFEYYNIGDPWNEFCAIVWSAYSSPHFAAGQIHGYFNSEPPTEFFNLLTLYISVLLLTLLSSWAVKSEFGRDVTLNFSQDLLKWTDNLVNPVPSWYFTP